MPKLCHTTKLQKVAIELNPREKMKKVRQNLVETLSK